MIAGLLARLSAGRFGRAALWVTVLVEAILLLLRTTRDGAVYLMASGRP